MFLLHPAMHFHFALFVLITLALVAQGQDLISQLPECAVRDL